MNTNGHPAAREHDEAEEGRGPWLVVALVILAFLAFFGVALATFLRYQGN